jgi:DUF4097 and DUF4098 domain-containing protein YvlB
MKAVPILTSSLISLAVSATLHAAGAHDFDQTLAAQAKGVVEISNVAGGIEVTGTDRNEVSVHGALGDGVERVDVTQDGARTVIKVVLPEHSHSDGEAHLKVLIPRGSELNVTAVSADVATSGVQGVQRLSAVSGDIKAEIAGSDAEIKTVSGDLKVKGHGQPAHLHVTSVSGDVRLEHGAGDLEASTVSGTLVVSLDSASSVRARTTSGDFHFDGKLGHGANFDASSVSGGINVRAAADGGYAYEVTSFSGDVSDCFDVKAERPKYGPGSSLRGSRGDGSGQMHLKTMSGDVELCDRN